MRISQISQQGVTEIVSEATRVPLSITQVLTTRCNYGCWFCSECSTSVGSDLEFELFLEMYHLLKRDGYQIDNVLITGGGEPLLYKHLPEVVSYWSQLNPSRLIIRTAGPGDTVTTENLQSLAKLEKERKDKNKQTGANVDANSSKPMPLVLEVSVHDNADSRQRLKNVIDMGLNCSILYRQDPRKSDEDQFQEYKEFIDFLESMNFGLWICELDSDEEWLLPMLKSLETKLHMHEEFSEGAEYFLRKFYGRIFDGRQQCILLYPFDYISPQGRAEKALKEWDKKFSWSGKLCRMFVNEDIIQMSVDQDGYVGVCNCDNRLAYRVSQIPEIVANYESIKRMVMIELLTKNKGRISSICDICPLYKNTTILSR